MDISKREILILGSLVIAAIAIYFFLLAPFSKERVLLTAEAKKLTQQAGKIRQALEAVPRGREGLEEARSRLEKIRERLLPPGGPYSFFSEVSRPSKRLGIRIVSFTPKGPDPSRYREVIGDLVVEGTYLQLGQYLEDLFGGPYLFSVGELEMHALEPGDPRLRMHVILKSWMREESR